MCACPIGIVRHIAVAVSIFAFDVLTHS
jgi:hypothetical protein